MRCFTAADALSYCSSSSLAPACNDAEINGMVLSRSYGGMSEGNNREKEREGDKRDVVNGRAAKSPKYGMQ